MGKIKSNESNSTNKLVFYLLEKAGFKSKDFFVENAGEQTWIEAMKGASKFKEGNQGIADFNFQSGKFHVLIEDKKQLSFLENLDEDGQLILDDKSIQKYAVNGAVHYAKWVVEHSQIYTQVFALGISGSLQSYVIQPYFIEQVNDKTIIQRLSDVYSLDNFTPENINEYYSVSVKGELSKSQKKLKQINDIANSIHEDLRNYGNLGADNKATVVSAILLALKHGMLPSDLSTGRKSARKDGEIIFENVNDELDDLYTIRGKKIGSMLDTFRFITSDTRLNTPLDELSGKTPLWHFTSRLSEEVYQQIATNESSFDILGSFYSQFVKYGGNDGSDLGIVLTPLNVTSLMTELIQISPEDKVLDPATGTGSFLIAAMNRMIKEVNEDNEKYSSAEEKEKKIGEIKQNQLYGIELKSKLYAIAATNMILRKDGRSNLEEGDMFHLELADDGSFDKILMNPPYSQAKSKATQNLSEMNFILKALSKLKKGGKAAFIVPQSTMTNGPKSISNQDYKEMKKTLLDSNRIIAVITMNPKTFYPYGVSPVILIVEHGIPQSDNRTILYDYTDDGNVLNPHLGMVEDPTAKEKRQRLIDTVMDKVDVDNKVSLKTTLTEDDEWLHSYFYFDESIPSEEEFMNAIKDYATFKYRMTIEGKGDMFE